MKFKFRQLGSFGRNAALIAGSSAASQIVTVASSPLLSRLYSPSEFGIFALYTTIVGILLAFATGKYEMAFFVPSTKSDWPKIYSIAVISLLICIALTIVGILLYYALNTEPAAMLYYTLALLPLGIGVTAYNAVLNAYNNTLEHYNVLARSKIVRSIFTMGTMISLGYFYSPVAVAIIIGYIIGQFAECFVLFRKIKAEKCASIDLKIDHLLKTAKTYKLFPQWTAPATLLLRGSMDLPVLAFNQFFTTAIAGQYSWMLRSVGAPLSLITTSLSTVYRQTAGEQLQRDGSCRSLLVEISKKALFTTSIPVAVVAFFGPSLFAIAFGEEWREAGEMATIMAPVFFLQVIVGPVSYTIELTGKNSYRILLNGILLIGVLMSATLAVKHSNAILIVYGLSATYCLKYILEWILCYKNSEFDVT